MSVQHDSLLEVDNVSKGFPGVQALEEVSLQLKKGEIHGLVGENGAGKSTLVKIITRAYKQYDGMVKIFKNSEGISINGPIEAQKHGIATAYQHLTIVPELSIGENFFVGNLPLNKIGVVNWEQVYRKSKKILQEYNIDLNPRTKINRLSVAQQALVTIIKITLHDPCLVILDEPTAHLTKEQSEMLYKLIFKLKEKGVGILYVSHYIEEVLELCDRITVLKDGRLIDTVEAADINENKIMEMMVGRKIEEMYDLNTCPKEEVLRVEDLSKNTTFQNISFSLKKQEILGFFGLAGAGRTEVMRSLFGAEKFEKGQVFLEGREIFIDTPEKALNHGIGLIPEDRMTQGLALPLSASDNINMSSYDSITKFGVLNLNKAVERAKEFIKKLDIRTPSYKTKVEKLSGGNQQKTVIAKMLCRELDVLIFDEATTGVDVGAKVEIYRLIERLISEGKSIIYISSYLPEIIGISDRIVVMSQGQIVGIVDTQEASEEKLLKMASKIPAKENFHG